MNRPGILEVACPSAPAFSRNVRSCVAVRLPVVLAESNAKLGVACDPVGCRKSVHPGAAGTGIARPGYDARSCAAVPLEVLVVKSFV
jgi:hypothetical protein